MNRQQRRAAAARGDNVRQQLQTAAQQIQAGNVREAERQLNAVLAADKRNPDALHLLGVIAYQRGNFGHAAELVGRALSSAPQSPLYWNTLGGAQRALGRLAEARDSFRKAAALAPDYAVAHANHGLALHALGPFSEAEHAFRRALALSPGYAPAAASLGVLLLDMRREAEAAETLQRALALDPGDRKSRIFLARALLRLQRFDEAAAALREILATAPDDAEALEVLHECRVAICDWGAPGEAAAFYRAKIAAGAMVHDSILPAGTPGLTRAELRSLGAAVDAHLAARAGAPPVRQFARAAKPKLRIGYLSGDFGEHPVAHVTAEMFERHDRARFETFAYSTGADDGSALRARLVRAFDRFADLRDLPVRAAADAIAADGIDILVDLAGYTQAGCPEILALRTAPLQVNYLGFPGTLGGRAADYILVDPVVCPPEHAPDYAEALAYLPDSYMPNDRQRPIAAPAPARAALGLPEDAFVFCCFNNSWKVTREIFALWMGVLDAVPGSVLWLRDFNAGATRHLRAAAAARGLAERVVFAGRADYPAHLARLGRADLFLDTLPYNAHATANDALHAGLPVLTCPGETFASRVGASLLRAAGLPELIAPDIEAYAARARALATNRDELAALRRRLADNRATAPLFDAARFTRNLEALYARMWQRHAAGQAPALIDLTKPD